MTTMSPIAGSSGIQPAPQNSNARLQAAIARLVGLPGLFPRVDTVATLSVVAQLQAQNADIRQLSANIVQALSLSQVADSKVSDIQLAAQQLQSLAQQAQSSVTSDEARQQLNSQFQQLVGQVNAIAREANFNGRPLLDGSLSGANALSLEAVISGDKGAAGSGDLSIADLTGNGLFNGANLNLLSSPSASEAVAALATALEKLAGVRSDIAIFQKALDYVAANLDSAQANQVAAQSQIQEAQIQEAQIQEGDAKTPPAAGDVQGDKAGAIAAQANRLSPTLLQLING